MKTINEKIGTINGFSTCVAISKKKKFKFDGTSLGLTNSAIAAGVEVGDVINVVTWGMNFRLGISICEKRTGGYWVDRIWPNEG